MPSVEQQVADLKNRIATAGKDRAKAEQQAAVAEDRVKTAIAALREEFGIEEPTEIDDMRAQLEADLAAELERVRGLLEKAEGQ